MHPRVVMLALAGVATDLLCLGAVAVLMLPNNRWLDSVGVARFWFVVMLVGIGLVPMMYARERQEMARSLDSMPERVTTSLPAWAGVERSATVG